VESLESKARRDEIIVAALASLAAGEPGVLTMRGLAARLGCAPATLYLHFASKDELLSAVELAGLAILRQRLEPALQEGEPRMRLRSLALQYLEFAFEQPGLDDLLFDPVRGPRPSPAVAEARSRLGRLLSEPLEQALAGHKRPPRAPWLALCMLRGAVGVTRWAGADPRAESGDLVDAGLALFGLAESGNAL
jgi:AcrR family transcriptional regulator